MNSYLAASAQRKLRARSVSREHNPPRLISYYLAGKKSLQNKNFDDHITTI
jgi:hypothetical protein